VEVQLSEQGTFYERAVFNSSLVIQELLPEGSTDWDFAPIYFIGIVNFPIHKGSDQVLFRYRLKEVESGEDMTRRLEYIFLELPNCKKALTPQATQLENFCYVLRNISTMEDRPKGLEGEIFDLLFNSAEIVNFAPMERDEYYYEMRAKRDLANQIAFARKEGVEEGMEKGVEKGVEKGQRSIISKLLVAGMPPEDISRMLDMPIEEVLAIQGE